MDAYEVSVGGARVSTAGTAAAESFELWASIMSESVMPCSMEPLGDRPFHGSLEPRVRSEPISIAVISNSDTLARHTRRHIAETPSPYVLAGLTTAGRCDIRCGPTYLRTPVGSMFVVDGERAQEAITTDYEGVMIRVRREVLLSASGLSEDEFPRARRLQPVGHEALVIDYFRRLVELPSRALASPPLLNAGIDLLAAALALGVEENPAESASKELRRQAVIAFLRDNLSDSEVTPETIAEACGLSRRKLFRILDDIDGGPMTLLRRMRLERARELLISAPERTVAQIAQACGFGGDRHFYRVFRAETGLTPFEYRDHLLSPTVTERSLEVG